MMYEYKEKINQSLKINKIRLSRIILRSAMI